MRLGLRGRFVAFVSAIVIALGVVLTALSVRVQSDRLRHELEERGKLLTAVVAAHAVDALALTDVRALRLLLDETRSQENVIDAVAFDAVVCTCPFAGLGPEARCEPSSRSSNVAPPCECRVSSSMGVHAGRASLRS